MKRKRSATQELAQKSKKRILIGNVNTSNRNIQITNSGQVSTGNKSVSPFWKNHTKEISIEVVVTSKDRFCKFAYELVKWILNKNGTKIMVLGSDVNIDNTKSDQSRIIKDEKRLKTRRIRMYLTPEEKEKLKMWMGTHGYNDCFTNEKLSWVKRTPREVRSFVIRQLMSAYKTNIKTHGSNFRMKYKSKKDRSQTISILARDWNRDRGVSFRCHRNQEDVKGKVISLDPGVRTLMTCYDPKGQIVERGNGDLDKIFKLSKKYDNLQSDKYQALGRSNKRKRYRLGMKMRRIVKKIRNFVDECHHQLARWLCKSYEIILLPKFESSNMVLKNKRKISKEICELQDNRMYGRLVEIVDSLKKILVDQKRLDVILVIW
ncbi:hypothetical protein Glove_88g28 [Diversispora epigaea]|uniref:Probable transposase IS891/IS1136/IS1341 domain-containing protein n=1 Tax=Diversispora epigaea TaxID=1348612 RepID=A0A397JCP1_9GLOM|nr:hypothetical protein Glove_88g28 [Diversispora epigaea]